MISSLLLIELYIPHNITPVTSESGFSKLKYMFLHNFRDTLIVVSVNAGASIFAGFVTFALIGSIAHDTNMPVKDLAGSGKVKTFS